MAEKPPPRRHNDKVFPSHQDRVGLRKLKDIAAQQTKHDGCQTQSSIEQVNVEKNCLANFEFFYKKFGEFPVLNRASTIKFLRRGLKNLSEGYECLDASRPWICYWILHALNLLGESVEPEQADDIVDFLARCQNPDGGFGGGPGQLSHLAPTYGAVNALCTLGTERAFQVVDRERLVRWMDSLRLPDGSFIMHRDGEVDIRGVYCALSVARILNIYSPELFKKTTEWVLRCQTYEGGFGGAPGMEAHGGYSFCGFAALIFMDHGQLCNVDNLLRWAVNRQMRLEGGFQGRTNKLVDGCYSFWQGGIFPLLHMILSKQGSQRQRPPKDLLFNSGALQEYLLMCCQDPKGGLIDKPGKGRDYYHTCYALSGLSVAQYMLFSNDDDDQDGQQNVVGHSNNKLKSTHPLYNICIDSAISASAYYDRLAVPKPPHSN